MSDSPSPPDTGSPTVGLLFDSRQWGDSLREAITGGGLKVRFEARIPDAQPETLTGVDVIVVNLDPALDDRLDLMDHLLALDDCRVIFNDPASAGAATDWNPARWSRHLLAKILNRPPAYPPAPSEADRLAASHDPENIWVLGASIGGPEAIRTFLSGLPHSIPCAFLLAQHMGEEFLDLMTNQLSRACGFQVRRARHGEKLVEGKVVVAPVDKSFQLAEDGRIRLAEPNTDSPYSPCIDDVVRAVMRRYPDRTGLIIFSGMASDAVESAAELAEAGGQVWAQTPESCVVSSMVEGAIAADAVGYTGTPEALAAKLVQRYENHGRERRSDTSSRTEGRS